MPGGHLDGKHNHILVNDDSERIFKEISTAKGLSLPPTPRAIAIIEQLMDDLVHPLSVASAEASELPPEEGAFRWIASILETYAKMVDQIVVVPKEAPTQDG